MVRQGYTGTTVDSKTVIKLTYIGMQKGHKSIPETIRFLTNQYAEREGLSSVELLEKAKEKCGERDFILHIHQVTGLNPLNDEVEGQVLCSGVKCEKCGKFNVFNEENRQIDVCDCVLGIKKY